MLKECTVAMADLSCFSNRGSAWHCKKREEIEPEKGINVARKSGIRSVGEIPLQKANENDSEVLPRIKAKFTVDRQNESRYGA